TLSSGDLERVWELLDEDTTWTVCAVDIEGAGTHRGREIVDDFLAPVRGWFQDGDPKVQVTTIAAEGPLVLVEAEGHGRFRNGTPYDNRYVFAFEIEGGRIRAIREYMDTGYAARIVDEVLSA